MANSERAFSLAQAVRQAVGDKPLEITGQVVQIPRDQITPNEANFYAMDEKGLESLATSIELTGLIHPIIVRPAEGGGYVITDGERRYRATGILEWPTVPAIVRTPVNAVLEELSLIEANRQSRRLTDAELSKQAERLQELLVALKESGVEIPGRIRSAVSEAMQVSESKLARLKKIRASLLPEFLEAFDAGRVNESVAYELAKVPTKYQRMITSPAEIGTLQAWKIRSLKESAEKIIRERDCPRGGKCGQEPTMFLKDRERGYAAPRCEGVNCCIDCPSFTGCRDVCCLLKSAQKEAKAKRALEREDQERHRQEAMADEYAAARAGWARFDELREAAGLRWNDLPCVDAVDVESLLASNEPEMSPAEYFFEVRDAIEVADALGVSLDDLMNRKTPAASPAIAWHLTEATPPDPGRTVIFWGSKGLRTPPAAAISNYIAMWPDEYTWWAYVSPPPEAELQPAGAYADADGLAPASEDPDKAPEINPTPSPVLAPGT